MDKIFITDLRVETIIGIYDWEREQKQTVSVDLEIGCDIKPAAQSENIDDAMNYKAISKRIESFMLDSSYLLVETMAERIAAIVLEEFNAPWVKVVLHKPGALSNSRDVGVIIERDKQR